MLIVPFIEMKEYRKIQVRSSLLCFAFAAQWPFLTQVMHCQEDLQKYVEENFQAHMVLIQHRRILPKEKQGHRLHKQKRPMSRTLVPPFPTNLAPPCTRSFIFLFLSPAVRTRC